MGSFFMSLFATSFPPLNFIDLIALHHVIYSADWFMFTAAWNLWYEYFPIYLLPVDGMKLNHGNLIQNGGRKQWRESSHTCTTPCSLLYVLQQEGRFFSLPSNNPANEKLQHPSQWEATKTLNPCFPPVNYCSKYLFPISSFPL